MEAALLSRSHRGRACLMAWVAVAASLASYSCTSVLLLRVTTSPPSPLLACQATPWAATCQPATPCSTPSACSTLSSWYALAGSCGARACQDDCLAHGLAW